MQRFFDIFFSGLGLLVLSPLLIPVMIVLRLTGEGEIFYIQQRVGKSGNPFGLFKFATMLKASPDMLTGAITVKGDPRVLPFGRILRKTKINELPQLINIFIGHMSIVGPRPQTPRCFAAFSREVQETIIKIRPGLTGIGSIIFRDEESLLHNVENPITFYDNVIAPYKGTLELWYIKHHSLQNYFLIIFITGWVVFYPNSKIIWEYFKDLPKPPKEIMMGGPSISSNNDPIKSNQ